MPQKLIQPVNNMTVTVSYKSSNYPNLIVNGKKIGVDHYGFDCCGASHTIWSQGHGVILATGYDTCYGNYVVAMYFDCENEGGNQGDIIANYFHLANIGVSTGDFVTKDTRLGVMGSTGTYSTGIHLHTEMRKYSLGQAKMLSPFATNKFAKDLNAGWIDPLSLTFTKTTAPDNQKYSSTGSAYINSIDKTNHTTK